jgi:hypothetical protein
MLFLEGFEVCCSIDSFVHSFVVPYLFVRRMDRRSCANLDVLVAVTVFYRNPFYRNPF